MRVAQLPVLLEEHTPPRRLTCTHHSWSLSRKYDHNHHHFPKFQTQLSFVSLNAKQDKQFTASKYDSPSNSRTQKLLG